LDRSTVYFGQVPLETDQLKQSQNTMVGLAKFCAGVLGTSTVVNGFTVTPTGPATLNVLLTAGEIYQVENLEQSIWSSLPADAAHSILKQGILADTATIGITPPGTIGFSQIFLIEVQYQDFDTGSLVLPYYNAANPSSPFSGPANAGTAQNTVRKGLAAYQVKAGIAAATGTQVAPTADAGWTGIFTVTVANGATSITSGNIAQSVNAPFIPVTLPGMPPSVQTNKWVYAADTGTTNSIVVSLPFASAPLAYAPGMWVVVKAAAEPTGPTVININALGIKPVVNLDQSAIQNKQWAVNSMLLLFYDGASFQLVANNYRQTGQPIYLQVNLDYYVNGSTGSDSNDGLAATVSGGHGPFATIQKAVNQIPVYNLNGHTITIHVADGTYSPIILQPMNGSGGITITGNTATPANCTISGTNASAIRGTNLNGTYTIQGFTLTASGAATADSISAVQLVGAGSVVSLGNTVFGTCVGSHLNTQTYAQITNVASCTWTVTGGCAGNSYANGSFVYAYLSGALTYNILGIPTINIANVITYAGAFVTSGLLSTVALQYTFGGAGSVNGMRYNAFGNAIISTGGGGANYYPGTIAGTTGSGGQYF
jgi:hypothetical protein